MYHIAERIENTAKEVDPGRATMLPCHGNLAAYEEANLINLSDILGMNLYNGWYGENSVDLKRFWIQYIKSIQTSLL